MAIFEAIIFGRVLDIHAHVQPLASRMKYLANISHSLITDHTMHVVKDISTGWR